MQMKSRFSSSATCGSSYDSPSITWHQWHHTAPMSSRIGLSSARACARTEELRHVLPPHGPTPPDHTLLPSDFFPYALHHRRHFFVVGHRAAEPPVPHLGARPERAGDPLRRLLDESLRLLKELAAEGPDRAAQVRTPRDHVEGVPGADLRDGDDPFLERIATA